MSQLNASVHLTEKPMATKKARAGLPESGLVDEDVINLVNLRFICDYHSAAPERVMDMRGQGMRFVVIQR